MGNSNKLLLLITVFTLIIVSYSYLDIKAVLSQQADSNDEQIVNGTSITISGTGDDITFTSGGGNCTSVTQIKAETSISSGGAGNVIEVTAKCSLSNFSAVASATDTGNGAATYNSATANAAQGRASCTHQYTQTAAPASAWTAVCTF